MVAYGLHWPSSGNILYPISRDRPDRNPWCCCARCSFYLSTYLSIYRLTSSPTQVPKRQWLMSTYRKGSAFSFTTSCCGFLSPGAMWKGGYCHEASYHGMHLLLWIYAIRNFCNNHHTLTAYRTSSIQSSRHQLCITRFVLGPSGNYQVILCNDTCCDNRYPLLAHFFTLTMNIALRIP